MPSKFIFKIAVSTSILWLGKKIAKNVLGYFFSQPENCKRLENDSWNSMSNS